MRDETEVIFYQGDRSDDNANKARHHDNEAIWTVESYDPKVTRRMVEMGATGKCSLHDGRIFRVDAKQLIEFIAASSGLVVEFRKHKKRQLSEETKAKLTERLAQIRHKTAV